MFGELYIYGMRLHVIEYYRVDIKLLLGLNSPLILQ